MRQVIATHPRKTALVLAMLASTVFYLVAFSGAVFSQRQAARESIETGSARVLSIRTEINSVLTQLNAEIKPDCDEKNLRQLREILVHTRFIADLGVLSSKGQVLCNTTAGLLDSPVSLGIANFSGKTAEGVRTSTYLDQTLPGVKSNKRTIISVQGRFYSAPPSDVLADLLVLGLSAVQLKAADGSGVHTAVLSEALSDEWRSLLQGNELVQGSHKFYDWKRAALVLVEPIQGTFYVAQAIVPSYVFFSNYLEVLVWAMLIALLIGWLTYFALRPIFLSWRALEYRIDTLLCPKNIQCVYQPIVDMATGKPTGCEVLMRLRNGNALIYPDIAIPAIIARDLTLKLDQLMLQVAIAELQQTLPELVNFKVAFNFFPSTVSGGGIREMVASALHISPHKGLVFDVEVLEQEYKDSMIQAVADLREHDFLVSVDDFGTGFSNLGSIKALLPDFLKIDRSFVQDMESATIRSSLIPEIIAIGHAVGAKLIAEGIENERQYEMLRDMGVEYGQGYFLCKPLPIDNFASYLRAISTVKDPSAQE